MKLDYTRFLHEGHDYIAEVTTELSNESWERLVKEKLSDASPADIEGMKTLWLHGFNEGASSAVSIVETLLKNTK